MVRFVEKQTQKFDRNSLNHSFAFRHRRKSQHEKELRRLLGTMTWTAATKLVPARPSTSCHTSIVTLARFSSQIIDAKLGTQFTCTRRGLTRQTTWVVCWRWCQRDYNWNSGQAQSCSKTGFRLRPGWAAHFILVLLRALKNRILKQVASNYMASQKRNNNLNRFLLNQKLLQLELWSFVLQLSRQPG